MGMFSAYETTRPVMNSGHAATDDRARQRKPRLCLKDYYTSCNPPTLIFVVCRGHKISVHEDFATVTLCPFYCPVTQLTDDVGQSWSDGSRHTHPRC